MTSLKTVARRAGLIAVAGCSAMALGACGAGQISQTANQVPAVDGASAETPDGAVALRDVTVIINDDGSAGLKFTAVNQDSSGKAYTLTSASVDGTPVEFSNTASIGRECTLVANVASLISEMDKSPACTEYVSSSVENVGFPPGGNADVTVTFSNGSVTTPAAITGNQSAASHQQKNAAS